MSVRRVLVILLIGLHAPAAGQGVPRVDTGWGVNLDAPSWTESSWSEAAAEIYAVWRQYLLNQPHLQAPTSLWSAAEQERWPAYDLTASLAYQGMPATVVDITPVDQEARSFIVQTLFASADRIVRPLALTRVWAIQEDGRWVFANALPRLTALWRHEVVGPITYIVHPDMPFDVRRAERAVGFADSLAASLNLQKLEDVTYVAAPTPSELHRIMGVDWTIGGRGFGYSAPWNKLILSGSRVYGEENRHELVHYIIGPILDERETHGIVNERLATWLGGSRGLGYSELLSAYAAYLRTNPATGLNEVLSAEGPDRGWYPAGAVLVEMVYERGGWPAVSRLLRSGRTTDALQEALVDLLELPWAQVANAWRARVLAAQ